MVRLTFQLAEVVQKRMDDYQDFEKDLLQARQELETSVLPRDSSAQELQKRRFLQGVVVLLEFTKEIAALLQARLFLSVTEQQGLDQ